MILTYHLLSILCYTLGSLYYAIKLIEAWRNRRNLSR